MSLSLVLAEAGGGGVELNELELAFGKEVEISLVDGISGSFSLTSGSIDDRIIGQAIGKFDVKVYRNRELLGRGRLVSAKRSGGPDGSTRSFNFVGYKQMLDRKKLLATDTAVTAGYTAIDLEQAAWNIIDAVQTRTGGSNAYNITRAAVSVGRNVTGTRVFEVGQTVRDALDNLSQAASASGSDDAFEWDVKAEGDDLVFYAWAPRRGKLQYGSTVEGEQADYFFDNRITVQSFEETFDFTTYANSITVQGSWGTNEIQTVNTDTPTSGTFTLGFRGAVSGNIQWNASLADIKTALEAMSTIGSGNIIVGGSTPNVGNFTVEFTGTLGRRDVETLDLSGGSLGGSSGGSRSVSSVAGSLYTKTVTSPDYDTSDYGTVEYVEIDPALTDKAAIDERAYFLLATKSSYTPTYTFDMMPSYQGKEDFWIGDYVLVRLSVEGMPIERDDLRVTGIHISGDDDESISVDVEIPARIDRTLTNLARRVAAQEAAAKARAAAIARMRAQQKKLLLARLSRILKLERTAHGSALTALKRTEGQIRAQIKKLG